MTKLPTEGMTTARWRAEVPLLDVPVARLVPTQDGLDDAEVERRRGAGRSASWCGDPYPHVVAVGSVLYIEDGHHRVAAAKLDGRERILARVLFTP